MIIMSTAGRTNKFLAVLVLLSAFFASSFASDGATSQNLKHLHNIESSMDRRINPCDDFYQYACGNYGQSKADSEYDDMMDTVEGKFYDNIKQILKTLYPDVRQLKKHGQSFTDKLQTFVISCQNMTARNVWNYLDVAKPAANLNWPLMDEVIAYQKLGRYLPSAPWDSHNKFDLFALLGQLTSYGLKNELISVSIQKTNGTATFVLGVPETRDLDTTEVLTMLEGTGLPRAVIEKYYSDIIDTHREWQTVYERFTNDDTAVQLSWQDLHEGSPRLATFFKNLVPEKYLSSDAIFAFQHMKFFEYLDEHKFSPSESRKLCNYLMIQFLIYLSSNVIPAECMNSAYHRMPLAVNYVYYQHEYLANAKQNNEHLTDLVKKLYKYFMQLVIENRLHFNDAQMQEIMTKLTNMITNVGNLPKHVNATMVDEYYSTLPDMNLDNYYHNELHLRKLEILDDIICPPGVVCTNELQHSPLNYEYTNVVAFPFASLKPPMYHSMYDPLLAYSLFGFIVGHEFGHAIDSDSLTSPNHFTTFDAKSLEDTGVPAAVECMKQKAATDFIRERVADAVGIRVAYNAYSREYGLQPNFTTTPWQQLFFLNMAHFFCTKDTSTAEEHDTPDVRVQQIAMNTEEFAQAFQCPSGSRMNPKQKCRYA